MKKYQAAVITVSDSAFSGQREDLSGPLVSSLLTQAGFPVTHTEIVPDEQDVIETALIRAADNPDIALVLTTGGTGFSPRDVTPEATINVCTRLAPGIPEVMRAAGMLHTDLAMLSRAQAGIRSGTLIINLPGSPKAIWQNLEAILPTLEHGLAIVRDDAQDCGGE